MSDSELDWGDDDVAENEQGGEDDWGDMVELDAADAAKAEERHQQQLPQHLLLALLKAAMSSSSASSEEDPSRPLASSVQASLAKQKAGSEIPGLGSESDKNTNHGPEKEEEKEKEEETLSDLMEDLTLKYPPSAPSPVPTVDQRLQDICGKLKQGSIKNVIVMVGAGLSVAAGIPDFRTPGTGLYDNLQKYNLPSPESIFTLSFFRENPQPFVTLAKELYPGEYKATKGHEFIQLLNKKNALRRCYSQNIDGLELVAFLSSC